MTAAELTALCDGSKPAGEGKWMAKCPGHDDGTASLSIAAGDDGRVLVHCHAGCSFDDILKAMGLEKHHLFPKRPGVPRSKGGGQVVAAYSYRDESGAVLYEAIRFEPKDFRQGHTASPGCHPNAKKKDGYCWSIEGVRRVLYRLPEILAAIAAGEPIWICEGEKDVENFVKLGMVATCNAGGASKGNKSKWLASYTGSLKGAREVVIVADKDEPGRAHAQAVAASLHGAGIPCKVVEVLKGKDSSDWIAAGATREDFEALGKDAPFWEPASTPTTTSTTEPTAPKVASAERGSRPEILLGVDEHRVVAEAIAALAQDPELYSRAGRLVGVMGEPARARRQLIERETDAPRIGIVPHPWVQVRLSAVADWLTPGSEDEGGPRPAHPPPWATAAVASAGHWPGIRPLLAIAETPIIRSDGTVLDVTGYDANTGILYRPLVVVPPIPQQPTLADAIAARDRLFDVVRDFPFASEAHRAAWLSAVLTMFMRYCYDGATPLFLFDANVRAAGKSLLARATALLALGRLPATMTLPEDEDERRKRITAIALAGDPLILLDNIEGAIGGAALNAALSSTTWGDRILGASQTTGTLPLYVVWFGTGNNATTGADSARRIVQIRIQSPLEKPEGRSDFAHPDLLAWIRAERPRLVADALTVCRAYFAAGRPDQRLPAMGSFEGWSLVRQVIVWAGMPDPLLTQVALAETSDREADELRGLILGVTAAVAHKGRPVTVRELLDFATTEKGAGLRDVFTEHLPGRDGEFPTGGRLSGRLRHFRGRVAGDLAIDVAPGRAGVSRWSTRAPQGGGVGWVGGVCSDDLRGRDLFSGRSENLAGQPDGRDNPTKSTNPTTSPLADSLPGAPSGPPFLPVDAEPTPPVSDGAPFTDGASPLAQAAPAEPDGTSRPAPVSFPAPERALATPAPSERSIPPEPEPRPDDESELGSDVEAVEPLVEPKTEVEPAAPTEPAAVDGLETCHAARRRLRRDLALAENINQALDRLHQEEPDLGGADLFYWLTDIWDDITALPEASEIWRAPTEWRRLELPRYVARWCSANGVKPPSGTVPAAPSPEPDALGAPSPAAPPGGAP